jgi:hypothetical protein
MFSSKKFCFFYRLKDFGYSAQNNELGFVCLNWWPKWPKRHPVTNQQNPCCYKKSNLSRSSEEPIGNRVYNKFHYISHTSPSNPTSRLASPFLPLPDQASTMVTLKTLAFNYITCVLSFLLKKNELFFRFHFISLKKLWLR